MKKGKIILRTIIVLVILAVALTAYLIAGAKLDTMEVAFYNLHPTVENTLINWLDEKNINWKPVVLDPTKPVNEQITGPVSENLLFIQDGASLDTVSPLARTAKTSNLMPLPMSLRTSVKSGTRLTATPLLIDHFQMSYNNDELLALGAMPPTNLTSLEAMCEAFLETTNSDSYSAPIICAGRTDNDLVKFFTGLMETLTGAENVIIAQSFLTENIDEDGIFNTECLNDFFNLPQVYETLEYIVHLENKGYLSTNWLNLARNHVMDSIENKSPLFAFLPHSEYLLLSENAKDDYETWYMPSGDKRETRYLVADIVTVMEFSYVKSPLQSARQAGVKNELASSLITELGSGLTQANLSSQTNLCPVNASTQIENIATAETLEYLSLADGVIGDISSSSFATIELQTQFANYLRTAIEKMREE